jgi:alcohol dehydrogenase
MEQEHASPIVKPVRVPWHKRGSITGSPYENERTLDFSVLTGVRPSIETMPLGCAAEALQKLKSGDVKFRLVLTMQ